MVLELLPTHVSQQRRQVIVRELSDIQISRKTERHGVARSTKIVVNDVTGVTRPNGPNLVEIRFVFLETRMESVLITIMKR